MLLPTGVWHLICLYSDFNVIVFDALLAADHVSHLENVSEDEINRLLGMVVDVENLFMSVHKEEDTDTKQVYFYLFKVSKGVSYISVTGTDLPIIVSPCACYFYDLAHHYSTVNIVFCLYPFSHSC